MIRRGVGLAKSIFHVASRSAERILPPMALWFLLLPLTEVMGLRTALRRRDRVPATRLPLPPGTPRASLWKRWRHFSREQSHWWLIGWINRLSDDKWKRRCEVTGLEEVTKLLAERPVLLTTLHTTSVTLLPAWLRAVGVPVAGVPMDPSWFNSRPRQRKAALAEKFGIPYVIPPSPREIIDFLTPGQALMLPTDFSGGRMTIVRWMDMNVSVSTGIFRIARTTGAAIVPALIFNTGRWRYSTTIFDAVPQDLIATSADDAAARYLVERLMPPAVARPEQAMAVLVETVKPASNSA